MSDRELVFRGLKGRTLADQQRAIGAGYESMQDYAIDELGQLLLELTQRVEALERTQRSRVSTTYVVPVDAG